MNIFFWPSDRSGCAHYRCHLPGEQLRGLGHIVNISQHMSPAAQDGGYDVLVGQRVAEPGPSRLWQRLAKQGSTKLVFELDDDFWSIDPSNRAAYAYYTPEARQRLVENIAASNLVTVSTSALAEVVRPWNSNVVVLPNCVPERLLDKPMPDQRAATVTFGYGGSTSHYRDFGELAKPLRRLLQRLPESTEFHAIGRDFAERVMSIRGRTRCTPWVPNVDAYLDTVDFHVGLAPLFPSFFNESKSYIKLLEYSALGIPAIVSGVGPYRRAVEQYGSPATLASSHQEWDSALAAFARDPEMRDDLGRQARAWAADHTIESNVVLWEKAYS